MLYTYNYKLTYLIWFVFISYSYEVLVMLVFTKLFAISNTNEQAYLD